MDQVVWVLETVNTGQAHQRSLPLTVTIAAQRPQEELSFRIGAVCITYYYLSDRQMVYKGQEPLVCSPVGIGCSDSILPLSCPFSLKKLALLFSPLRLVSVTIAVQCRVHTALLQPTGTALDPRLGASPVEVLLLISANPKAVGVASWGKTRSSFQPPPLRQPLSSSDLDSSSLDLTPTPPKALLQPCLALPAASLNLQC